MDNPPTQLPGTMVGGTGHEDTQCPVVWWAAQPMKHAVVSLALSAITGKALVVHESSF